MLWNLLCCFGSLLVLSEERLFKYDFFFFFNAICYISNTYAVLWILQIKSVHSPRMVTLKIKKKQIKHFVNIWDSLEIETGMCVYSRSWWTQKLWGCHPGWIPISAWWFNSMEGGVWKKILLFTCQTIKTSLHNGKDPTISTLHSNCWCQWLLEPLWAHARAHVLSSALLSP